MLWIRGLGMLICWGTASVALANDPAAEAFLHARRVVFLGDSVTAAGGYLVGLDAWLAVTGKTGPEILNLGLPSETVSGLSEEGHAGGQFPRPDLAERLDRVLKLTKPDLVVACYGMNCAIYEPLDETRFARYRTGITALKAAVEQAGAKLILITPPVYDDLKAPKNFSYNEVLDRYSAWLLEQRKQGWWVVDLHGPMNAELKKRRETDASFTFQPDGVHPNDAGQWCIAQQLIGWLGEAQAAEADSPQAMLATHQLPAELLGQIAQRIAVLHDAYLFTAGHKRPGLPQGLPIAEAEAQAKALTARIQALVSNGQGSKR